jgi:hypothetical protein
LAFQEVAWLRDETSRLTSQARHTFQATQSRREREFLGVTNGQEEVYCHLKDICIESGDSSAVRLEPTAVAAAARSCEERLLGGGNADVVAELMNCSLRLQQHVLEQLGRSPSSSI